MNILTFSRQVLYGSGVMKHKDNDKRNGLQQPDIGAFQITLRSHDSQRLFEKIR